MLQAARKSSVKAGKARFVIVASEYNRNYVDSMLRGAQSELKRAGAGKVQVIRVPGAYEVPIVAARVARLHRQESAEKGELALICLGVILRGETVHAAHIGDAVSRALMEIQLRYEVPVVHEVLLLESHSQAEARCLDPKRNRGKEAAQTALAMAAMMSKIGTACQ